MAKNIEMNYYNGQNYESLYPYTIPSQVLNLLNDDTKTYMGLTAQDYPDDAFRLLYNYIALNNKSSITFIVLGDDGSPCQNIIISSSSFCDIYGTRIDTVETDSTGKVSVLVNSLNVNVSISGYADLENFSDNYQVEYGQIYTKNITLNRRNFLLIESSREYIFSNNVNQVDVSCCGGGGGGGNSGNRTSGGSGGGGGYSVIQEKVSFLNNIKYQATIGQGGASDSNGGSSSFLQVVAQGGTRGSTATSNISIAGGIGNGNGGASGGVSSNGHPGTSGSTYIFSSFSDQILVGGGGGGGASNNGNKTYLGGKGGNPGGGNGGDGTHNIPSPSNGQNGSNFGGGGGGGGKGWYNTGSLIGQGGKGGQGCVAIRMHLINS